MWPVILRELRANSRRWTTYWLRLLAAGAVVGGILFWFENTRASSRQPGAELFAHMHRVLLGIVWILVPLMTCDCLSSERREGTLGLLFLTNLRARQIVGAKVFVHLLQAFTLWAAVVPIVTVPLLLGGLSWKEILFSLGWTVGSMGLAAAAGIAASSASTSRTRAVISALCLSGGFLLAFTALGTAAMGALVLRMIPGAGNPYPQLGDWIEFGLTTVFGGRGAWNEIFMTTRVSAGFQMAAIASTFVVSLLCFVILLGVIGLAALQIRRHWQDRPKTARQTAVEKVFYSPIFLTSLFRRWMRWSLEHNPIGWLERRSWVGRIAALIWVSVMVSFASAAASYANVFRGDGISLLNALMWMLLISIGYVAAGSFRRERETGALELILVTPLRVREIIMGRLRGIWAQFFPAFAVWVAVVMYLYSWNKQWKPGVLVQFSVIYFAIPVVGLYFSLRTRLVLVAWALTLLFTFALPQFIPAVLHRSLIVLSRTLHEFTGYWLVTPEGWVQAGLYVTLVVTPLLLSFLLLWRLHVNLARRSFSYR